MIKSNHIQQSALIFKQDMGELCALREDGDGRTTPHIERY